MENGSSRSIPIGHVLRCGLAAAAMTVAAGAAGACSRSHEAADTTAPPNSERLLSSAAGDAVASAKPQEALAKELAALDFVPRENASCAAAAILAEVPADEVADAMTSLESEFPFDDRGSPVNDHGVGLLVATMRCVPEGLVSALIGLGFDEEAADCGAKRVREEDAAAQAMILYSYSLGTEFAEEATATAAALGRRSPHGGSDPTSYLVRLMAGCLSEVQIESILVANSD